MTQRTDHTLRSIADLLAEQQDIRLAIVFGSAASGTMTPDSDLDVAVLGERPLGPERRMQLIEGLAQATGRAVDLIDLKTAGTPIARTALLKGKVVFRRDETSYPMLLSRLLIDSADFLPYRERLLKRRRDAWIR